MKGFYCVVDYITSCGVEGGMGMNCERGICGRLRARPLLRSHRILFFGYTEVNPWMRPVRHTDEKQILGQSVQFGTPPRLLLLSRISVTSFS